MHSCCNSPWRTPVMVFVHPLCGEQGSSGIGDQAHRLIPRCVITQSSGKQRVIDNGDTGGQSDLSSDANRLTLCSPVRPAQHISLVMHCWSEEEVAEFCQNDAWETGREDLPSAYRYCPMSQQESLGCVVVLVPSRMADPCISSLCRSTF